MLQESLSGDWQLLAVLISCFKSAQMISLLPKSGPWVRCTSMRPRVFVRPGSLYRQVFSMIFRPLLLLFYFLLPYLLLHSGGNKIKKKEKTIRRTGRSRSSSRCRRRSLTMSSRTAVKVWPTFGFNR